MTNRFIEELEKIEKEFNQITNKNEENIEYWKNALESMKKMITDIEGHKYAKDNLSRILSEIKDLKKKTNKKFNEAKKELYYWNASNFAKAAISLQNALDNINAIKDKSLSIENIAAIKICDELYESKIREILTGYEIIEVELEELIGEIMRYFGKLTREKEHTPVRRAGKDVAEREVEKIYKKLQYEKGEEEKEESNRKAKEYIESVEEYGDMDFGKETESIPKPSKGFLNKLWKVKEKSPHYGRAIIGIIGIFLGLFLIVFYPPLWIVAIFILLGAGYAILTSPFETYYILRDHPNIFAALILIAVGYYFFGPLGGIFGFFIGYSLGMILHLNYKSGGRNFAYIFLYGALIVAIVAFTPTIFSYIAIEIDYTLYAIFGVINTILLFLIWTISEAGSEEELKRKLLEEELKIMKLEEEKLKEKSSPIGVGMGTFAGMKPYIGEDKEKDKT